MGISAVFHKALAFPNARMNPVYPCTDIARGIPMNPKILVNFMFSLNMKYPYMMQFIG